MLKDIDFEIVKGAEKLDSLLKTIIKDIGDKVVSKFSLDHKFGFDGLFEVYLCEFADWWLRHQILDYLVAEHPVDNW